MPIDPQNEILSLSTVIKDCEMLSLVIPGPIPSKKNSKNVFYKNGRMMVISSKNHQDWHKIASVGLKSAPRINGSIKLVLCIIYATDRRKFDLTNKIESVFDLLVDCGIIDDDNYEILSKILVTFGGIDKESPRAEVTFFTSVHELQETL